MTTDYQDDVTAIGALLERMFEAISWNGDDVPDWQGFTAPIHEAAVLYPSSRPSKPTTADAFVTMMEGQRSGGGLTALEEKICGHRIAVFGNIAVALSGYVVQVNGGQPGQGVNGMLLLKEDGKWRIGAMCWDNASPDHPLPDDLG